MLGLLTPPGHITCPSYLTRSFACAARIVCCIARTAPLLCFVGWVLGDPTASFRAAVSVDSVHFGQSCILDLGWILTPPNFPAPYCLTHLCSHWRPYVSHTDWRLQSDAVPGPPLQDPAVEHCSCSALLDRIRTVVRTYIKRIRFLDSALRWRGVYRTRFGPEERR